MSSVPVALGSVDPEQQCFGEGGRRELLGLESFQGSLAVVTPCQSQLRDGYVAQSRVQFPGRRPPAQSWQPHLSSLKLAAV